MAKRQDKKPIFGIDIGNDTVKVVRGIKQAGAISVLDFAQKSFTSEGPPDFVRKNIQEVLSSLIDLKKLKKDKVHVTISGRKLCIRVITLPVMPAHELRQAVKTKIRKYVSPDVDDIYSQFFVLGERQEKGATRLLDVLFVAMQKNMFEEYLQIFEPFKIQPHVLTSACFCGWALVRHLGLNRPAKSLMLINIDGRETDLTVYSQERFIFTRNVWIGAKDFIDSDKAAGHSDTSDSSLPEKQAGLLCKEIDITSQHYYQIMHGQHIERCFVLGEGCRIRSLMDLLKQKIDILPSALEIPVEQLQISQDRREEFSKDSAIYAQALGALVSDKDEFNLIGQEKHTSKSMSKTRQKITFPSKTNFLIGIFAALAVLLFCAFKGISVYYQHNISLLTQRQDQGDFDARAMKVVSVKRMMDLLEAEKEINDHLVGTYPSYLVIIDQIFQAIPDRNIIIDDLSFASKQKSKSRSKKKKDLAKIPEKEIDFTFKGRLSERNMAGFEVTKFVAALEESGYFENISVEIKGVLPGDEKWFRNTRRPSSSKRRPAKEIPSDTVSFIVDGKVKLQDKKK